MEKEISIRNTKNEILDAFNEIQQKLKEKKVEEPKKIQERQNQETIVKNVSGLSFEGIVKGVTTLKLEISGSLDKLGENLASEYKKFAELQEANRIEKQNLEDLYQVSANADSLAIMLLAQKEKKEQFEQHIAQQKAEQEESMKVSKEAFDTEVAEKKVLWKKEQESQASQQKEEAERLKKERVRVEEEYEYNLKISRKKESDIYEEKKQKLEKEIAEKRSAFEKEIVERESKITGAEAELEELRSKSKAFPDELEKAFQESIQQTTEKLQLQYKFEKELTAKQTEGDSKLKDQTIEALKSKIKDMETSIKELSQKTVTAESSVKDIAMKAIESSSKMQFIEKQKEKPSID